MINTFEWLILLYQGTGIVALQGKLSAYLSGDEEDVLAAKPFIRIILPESYPSWHIR